MSSRPRSVLRWFGDRPGLLVGATVALAVTWPLLRRGYVLSYDMVFVPGQPITRTTLGLDGSVPRAVPTDLVVALASRLMPADVLQKMLLVAVFVLAGWGVARLVPGRAPAAAAAIAYTWNAYIAERLVIGHLSVLVGYALLPWAAHAALRVSRSGRGLPALCLWLLAAALCGATAGVTVTTVVLVVLLWRVVGRHLHWSVAAFAALTAVAANAPWWLAALVRPGGIPADPRGVALFAAHPDGPLGVLGSLVTLGGIWNDAVVPPERGVVGLAVVSLVGVLVAITAGARRVAGWWDGAGAALLVAGLGSLLVAAAGWLPGAEWLLRALVVHVPGGGLLRDGQKFLAPFALGLSLCVGATVNALVAGRRAEGPVLAAGLAVLPVLVLPGLVWGVAGRLSVAHYPDDWSAVRRLVATSTDPGDVAVLPWSPYRRFEWNHDTILLDPAQRMFSRPVLVNDDLPLTTGTVRGEDERAARVTRALAHGEPLQPLLGDLGVRFVLVERAADNEQPAQERLPGARRVFSGHDLELYELPTVRAWHRRLPWFAPLGLVLAAAAGVVPATIAIRRRRPCGVGVRLAVSRLRHRHNRVEYPVGWS